jgi:hypothetical protein
MQRDKQMKGSGNFKGRRIEEKGEHDRELKGKERIKTAEETKSLVNAREEENK